MTDPHATRAAALRLLADERTEDDGRQMLCEAAAAMEPVGGGSRPSPDAPALEAWITRHLPAGACRLSMRTFDRTGRGLAAADGGLLAGAVALRVPTEHVLTARSLPSHSMLDGWHGDLRLAVALLREPVRAPDGAWAAYTRLLLARPVLLRRR